MKEKKLHKILNASYMDEDKAERQLKRLGYNYDKELSNPKHKVFVDKNGSPHVAFRGSKGLIDDFLGSDLKLAVGLEKYDPRFKESKAVVEQAQKKYGKNVNTYGDSLGGSLAEKSGAKGNIYTHNKGVGLFDIGKTIPSNQTDYRNQNDIVSLLATTQKYNNNNLITKKTGNDPLNILGNHTII